MSQPEASPLRWSVEQRLAFLERRLFWDGQINRSDLTAYYSISIPQASADLAHYEQLAPGNLEYDKSAKAYVSSPDFAPRLEDPSARHYLAQLQLIADDVMKPDESWLGSLPPYSVVPRVRRRLGAQTLRSVLDAIRRRQALKIEYQSFSSPKPSVRWIAPHALGFDGYRWHMRAWCYTREQFLDFVLARILTVLELRDDETDPIQDTAWQRTITIRLGPNPDLPESQRNSIELDFGMISGVVEVEVRLCLVYYFKRQMLLDIDPGSLPPGRVQVVLLNDDEVCAALREAGES